MSQHNSNSLSIKLTLLLTSTLTVMSGATIAPSLPAMQEHFANTENVEYWVRLVLTVPALFITIGGLVSGQLVDRVGRKPLLVASSLLYGVAGSSGFILNSLVTILIGRALLGLAVAGIMTGVTTLIADYYTGQKRANFMGLQAAFMGLGGVIFLSLGGFVADFNWRFPFLIYLSALGVLVTIILTLYEPNRNPEENIEGNKIIYRDKMPLRLLTLIYGIALLYMISFYTIPVQIPFYLQNLSNSNATASGLAIAASTLASAIASLRYGFVKEHLSFVTITIFAFSIAAIGYLIIGNAISYQIVLLGLIVTGLSFGLLMPNLNVWLSTSVSNRLRGRALGGLTTFFFLGQFLSPIASQPVTDLVGLSYTYSLVGVLLSIVAIILFMVNKQVGNVAKS